MTTFIDLIPDSREICIEELINRTVQEPSKKEFDELEEMDRDRTGIKGDLTDVQGRRYNNGKLGKININAKSVPFDQNRVMLQTPIKGSDFVNASWIQNVKEYGLYDIKTAYGFLHWTSMNIILTQNSTPDTRQHYLQLIHEQRIDALIHIGSDNDFPDWNDKSYGHLSSELIERTMVNDFIVREKIDVSAMHGKSTINHTTTIYHFTAWPLNDTFSERDSKNLLIFINFVRKEIGKSTTSTTFTMAAHDSNGGIGGAATFIALYQTMHDVDSKILEKDSGEDEIATVNLFGRVNELRKKRAHMIQTFSNYKFLFKTLALYASQKSCFDMSLPQKEDYEDDNFFGKYYLTEEEPDSPTNIYVN